MKATTQTIATTLMMLMAAASCTAQAETQDSNIRGFSPTQAVDPHALLVPLAQSKRQIALDLSRQYRQLEPLLQQNINQYQLSVSATDMALQPAFDAKVLKQADALMSQQKGLPGTTDLVQLRLADTSMLTTWQQGESPLFAFEPDGDDSQWDYIEAFDTQGNVHLLDVYALPERPVFVVGLDNKKAMKAGIAQMRSTFAAAQKTGIKLQKSNKWLQQNAAPSLPSADTPLSTTVIKQISLNDDMEPWISGKAEVYAIVTGVSPSRDEPVLDIVEMPYLDYADKEYYPNQIVIHWQRYRWAAADMVLMEHDDGTNYKALATKLIEAAEQILRLIPDPQVQGFAVIAQITNGILAVMPDAWFTNDDDFVDVYYTLQEGVYYPSHKGANGNATASFEPLQINPR
ncbi:DUF3103 domain-containing protein [Shewanella sp. SR44-3]|uniref:DUF3103 domain-containing protein n=1 Tax=unclassified Shewanella TaxID=196818 RepID=UPI0015FBDE50|nr:DUF3103 domain-containing protein [Shewanella sp. SR44-3]MBB1270509.1 DUF3103 domain-containing protein [Shewanella sp. SR44-3]